MEISKVEIYEWPLIALSFVHHILNATLLMMGCMEGSLVRPPPRGYMEGAHCLMLTTAANTAL